VFNLILYIIEFKKTIFKLKINSFFSGIEDIVSKYLKIYIIKPSSLMESEDMGFQQLELYNLKNSVLTNMSFESRLNLYNRIKIKHINANNCMYFSYNYHGLQPLIFTIWSLGEEIRIGCFLSYDMDKNVFSSQKKKIEKLFELFKTPLLITKKNEIERNDYYLTEIILTNKGSKSIYDQSAIQIFIGQIFSVVLTQNILEYIENTEMNTSGQEGLK
jgi:hypothetical protein